MKTDRPSARLTTRVLMLGSLSAAVLLGVGFVLGIAGAEAVGKLVGNIGIVVLLLTPVGGLVATWLELRVPRPAHAWIAVGVLLVLLLATVVALAARV